MNHQTLRHNLSRTWGAFFRRYGNFTAPQMESIPPLLDGENVLLCAATASGKTEAALAPLIERYLPPRRPTPCLTLLYLLPTRALINDLQSRLTPPLEQLEVSCAVKTHDFNSFNPKHPTDILLTTPESLDSLLTAYPRLLSQIRAVVIDEIHVFDGNVRGDQLRLLLNRLRRVRAHAVKVGDADDDHIQYVGLSATLVQPDVVAARYFPDARIVVVPGSRELRAEFLSLDGDAPRVLLDFLNGFRERGWRKALVFCNTRADVENYAAAVRSAHSPFGAEVYVHYSNLSRERRFEIEESFAHAEAALCFASSTLELGIDIGTIDVVLLIGVPGSFASFAQRAGRGGRRQQVVQIVCIYRTPLEAILFKVLLNVSEDRVPTDFRLSVAVQQIFSLLKQSPNESLRLRTLVDLFDDILSAAELTSILGELQALDYLTPGRLGEWRAGERLHRLVDLQNVEHNPLSLYSNIQNSNAGQVKVLDQHSQRVLARVDRQWLDRDRLILEGRSLQVSWYDGEALWVTMRMGETTDDHLRYRSTRQVLHDDVTCQIPSQLGLSPGTAPYLRCEEGWLWFHWLGNIYGRALLDLVGFKLVVEETSQPGICLILKEEPRSLPIWTMDDVRRYLHDHYRKYESLLALGAYYPLLPLPLRRRTLIEQFNVSRFLQRVANLSAIPAPETQLEPLQSLLL